MAESSLSVEHLFTVTLTTNNEGVIQNGPAGTRAIVGVTGGTFEGPKLKGTVVDSGGDWVTVRADGTMKLDVRVVLKTEDGAQIYMTYFGIGVRGENGLQLRTAPSFETGAEQYGWLNNVQAVGVGHSVPGSVTYDVYALR